MQTHGTIITFFEHVLDSRYSTKLVKMSYSTYTKLLTYEQCHMMISRVQRMVMTLLLTMYME